MRKKLIFFIYFFIGVEIILFGQIKDGVYRETIPEIGERTLELSKNTYKKSYLGDEEKGTFTLSKKGDMKVIKFDNKTNSYENYYLYDGKILVLWTDSEVTGIYSSEEFFNLIFGNYSASSTLIEFKDKPELYHPFNLFQYGYNAENTLENFWVEGVKGYGVGEEITMDFFMSGKQIMAPHDVWANINGLIVFNGVYKTDDLYRKNSRLKKASVNSGKNIEIADTKYPQIIYFDTRCLKTVFEILDVYKGSKWDDTCVTKLFFFSFGEPDVVASEEYFEEYE